MIFVPVAVALANFYPVFILLGQSEESANIATWFLRASLPHILFTEMFDIQKHLLNSYRLPYV